MKKRNLLSLSALVLSLGLVVTSCAGTPGAEGKPGAEGPQGPQGPQGEPGEPGKTYIDVITRDWNWSATGSVKQDKYAVEAGKNETVTFTFTPTDEANNLVIDIKINDVVVADVVEPNEKGELEFTLKVDETYQSVQLTAATFTNVQDYGQLLLQNAGKAITDADKSINLSYTDGEETLFFLGEGEDSEYVENEYSSDATIAVQDVYDDAEEAVQDAYKKALTDHKDDIPAQLKAIKEVAVAEVTKINDAYTTAIDDAKLAAKDNLEDLMEEVSSDKYTDEDKGAQKDVFSGKIDEITTIEDLGSVINGAAAASSYNKDNAEANNFVFLKNYAFNEVQDALESVQGFEDELEDDPTLEAKLKNWGVDSTALPSGIAEEHFKTISAATEIEWVPTKGTDPQHTDLGRAGATAVKGAIQNIKDTVVDSVKEKYHKEINESAALAGSDTTKTALLGVVDTAISNFVTEDKSTTASETAFSLTQYVGTEVEITWIDTEKGNTIKDANRNSIGLIGYVEYCLAKPVNGSTNTAFANERLQKARSEANATLKAKKDEITDSTFKTLTSYKKVKINNADTVTIANKEVGKGTVTKTVDNPFFKSPTVDETNKVVTTGGLVTVTESGVEVDPDVTLLTGATFNLDDYYTALTKETVTQEGFGTLYIQEWANGHLNDFEAIYFAGLDYLHTKLTGASAAPTGTTTTGNTGVKGAVNLSGLPGTYALKADGTGYELVEPEEDYDYVGADAIIGEDDGKWTALDITVETDSPDYNDAGEIATYADGIADNLDSLVALNNGFKTWYKGKVTFEAPATAAEDAKFKTHFEGGETVSSLRKEFNAKLDAAMKGELSESAAKSWTREANLDKLYEADVAAYLEVAKDIALERKQEAASQTTNVEDKLKVEAKYAKFVEAIGKYVVASDNYDVTDPTTWKLADKKPSDPIKLKHDYTCKSITTVDAWLASVVVNLNA